MDQPQRTAWIRAVIERYEAPLIRYARQLVGNSETARDVVQDTFYRFCQADHAAIEEHVGAWLYRVCRNRAFDVQRKERPMRPLSDERLEGCSSSEPTPAAAVEEQQSASLAVRLLGGLPPAQQEVIRLKFQEGLSYREIAEVTSQSVTNVGFLIHSGMRLLRERMARAARPVQPLSSARSLP